MWFDARPRPGRGRARGPRECSPVPAVTPLAGRNRRDVTLRRSWAMFKNNLSYRRVGWQDSAMGADAGFLGRLGPELLRLLPVLDERSRRLAMGMAAAAAGEGGT